MHPLRTGPPVTKPFDRDSRDATSLSSFRLFIFHRFLSFIFVVLRIHARSTLFFYLRTLVRTRSQYSRTHTHVFSLSLSRARRISTFSRFSHAVFLSRLFRIFFFFFIVTYYRDSSLRICRPMFFRYFVFSRFFVCVSHRFLTFFCLFRSLKFHYFFFVCRIERFIEMQPRL